MTRWLRSLWDNLGARDVFVVAGVLLLTLGAGLVYAPAAPITAGLVLLIVGVFGLPRWS